jgi:AcrR family transcriptional regulator
MATRPASTFVRRRDRQREETRRDLAFAALELASARGLANVRVPDIAAVAGVSPRTFNNYFQSKEAAIAWPAARRAARLSENLLARPEDERLGVAIVAAVSDLYQGRREQGFPDQWLRKFRSLVAQEPALYGEYLKAADAGERALANAIRTRTDAAEDALQPMVLAAVVAGAERAGVRHWMQQQEKSGSLVGTVRAALEIALQEVDR